MLSHMPPGGSDSPHLFVATGLRWTAPPGWPEAPPDWTPTADWRPDPAWGPPPPGWAFLRLSDCAADADLPLEYRDPDLDKRFREYIANPHHPARAFVKFLGQMVDIVSSAFKVTGEVERVGKGYRDVALRSVRDATDVLQRAERAGQAAPFVFFACMQDAMSAVMMFAAAADHSVDDGKKEANLAVMSGDEPDDVGTANDRSNLEQEASEKYQALFDGTVARVMAVFHEALRQAQLGGGRAVTARRALKEVDEVQRLIEHVGAGRMGLNEGLQIIERMEAAGRRAAAMIGAQY